MRISITLLISALSLFVLVSRVNETTSYHIIISIPFLPTTKLFSFPSYTHRELYYVV